MSDWITKAIKTATEDRRTEREYALLRETTYRRLFPLIQEDIRKHLEHDVEAYNAHFPNDHAKHLKWERALVPYIMTVQKTGDSPVGSMTISLSEESRCVSTLIRDVFRDGGRQIEGDARYSLRLDGESIVIEDGAGLLLTVPELSRRILEPFFVSVT